MHAFRAGSSLLATSLVLLAAGCGGNSDSAPPPPPVATSQVTAADQAYTYTIPIFKFYATQRAYIAQGIPPNYFVNATTLADATERTVTKPNHDTLYSIAWIKLDNGPLEVDTPDSGTRYFSLAFMDAYTNVFAVHGTRVDGGVAQRLWLVGPGWSGDAPAGTVLVQSQTNSVWALGRTYVDGTPEDYPLAYALQAQLKIVFPEGTSPLPYSGLDLEPPAPPSGFWPGYFTYVDQLLTQNPPPAADDSFLAAGPETIGVGPGLIYENFQVDPAQIDQGASAALLRASTPNLALTSTGWAHATEDVGNYGTNYDLRAQEALTAFGVLPDAEAVYFIATAAAATPSSPLDGNTVYQVVFPAGQLPPTNAFWSLTLYEGTDQSQAYFYDNPDNIYAISWPASHPALNADGSLTLTISNVKPADVPMTNWLPAPAGPYNLQLRDYLPTDDVLSGTWEPPAIVAAG
jgi:hypothetical protein